MKQSHSLSSLLCHSHSCISIAGIILLFLLSSYAAKAQQHSPSPRIYSGKTGNDQQHRFDLSDELKTMYDIAGLPAYRSNTLSAQVSTYDTTGGNEDGFSGKYSFIRRNADSSLVIFETPGPGVIERIWTPTPTEDTLDFFIDDTTGPAWSIAYTDLFSGKSPPFVPPLCGSQLGGNYCYFPILFGERCRIVCRGKKMQFHQIQYRLFPKDTRVKNFSPLLTPDEKAALEKIKSLWNKTEKTLSLPGSSLISSSFLLQPGETRQIARIPRGGRITGIELGPAGSFEGAERNIFIRIYWDQESLPAVYCPVADFFGYSFGRSSMRSLLLGSQDQKDYCYFPMPFDSKARIELIYSVRPGSPNPSPALHLTAKIFYTSLKRDTLHEGKLYTAWEKQRPAAGHPHVFLNAKGRGHYVGTLLQAQGLQPGMTYFFEGDDSTVIDGSLRLHGTGSEDYFNGGWYAFQDCWDTRMSLPIHGALDYSLPYCRTGGYRLYLSDKLSFEKNIYHSIEHGPAHNAVPVEYTSLAFYYCDTQVSAITDPASVQTRVYSPDTLVLFPQLLEFGAWNDVGIHPLWAYPTGGESFDLAVTGITGIRISLKDILPGHYRLYADYESNDRGALFSVWQRQTQLSGWQSTWSPDKTQIPMAPLNDLTVDDLANTLTLHFKTKGNKDHFFLNRLVLVRQSSF